VGKLQVGAGTSDNGTHGDLKDAENLQTVEQASVIETAENKAVLLQGTSLETAWYSSEP
jgi:hypothetical protein